MKYCWFDNDKKEWRYCKTGKRLLRRIIAKLPKFTSAEYDILIDHRSHCYDDFVARDQKQMESDLRMDT